MNLKIHSGEPSSASPRSSKSRPANYSSTSVKLRLGSLVAALGLVFIAMNEAAKPGTWERLGFGGAISSQPDHTKSEIRETEQSDGNDDAAPSPVAPLVESFWEQQFSATSMPEKQALSAAIIPTLTNRATSIPTPEEQKNLLEEFMGRTNRKLASVLNNNDDEEFRTDLKYSVDAMMQLIDGPVASENQNHANMIIDQFTQSAFATVEDRSSMNRSAERIAWIQAWRQAERRLKSATYSPVSYIQLSGQPDAYRGQAIQIQGTAQGAEKMELPTDHLLGFDSYNVLWVKPDDSKRNPICVYAKELPNGFPRLDKPFVKMNEPVSINGLFFKLRSYTATNHEVEICPLIIADKISWTRRTVVEPQVKWSPPKWMLFLFLIGMPVVAAMMAWGVYRSTESPIVRRRLDANDPIEKSLNELAKDTEILTAREQLQQLADAPESDATS